MPRLLSLLEESGDFKLGIKDKESGV